MKTFFPYTPRQETLEDLRACFVARESLLNELLDSIREQSEEENLQHWMIIGSRGLGKSHLIALLYHSVKEDPGLSKRWIPLLMNEEEHGVFSLHTLFTRILTVLSEEVEGDDPERAKQLASYLGDLKTGKISKEDILEGVLACLKDYAEATSRRLLLMIENADDLFTRSVPKINEIKRLRKILQHDNHILLIATSPGQFGRMSSSNAPLYQFFRIRNLELFSFEQALELLNCWSKMDPEGKEGEPFRPEDTKLRVLYHLTGGNPRLLLFLYMAVSGQGGIKRAVDTFSMLLEQDLSSYYLSRLRDLSNQEQPIVIALAEATRNLTQKEIAQQTFLPQASIGTSMVRLENRGIVGPVSRKKGKNTPYALTDHLFRLWYKWRTGVRERNVIEALVEFLGIWYRRKELQSWSAEKGSIGLYCREALQFRTSELFRKYTEPFKIAAEIELKEKLSDRDFGGFFDTLSLLREWADEESKDHVDRVLKGISNGKTLEDALDYLRQKLKRDPDNPDLWVDMGVLLERKGDMTGAVRAFAKALELDSRNSHAWFHIGLAHIRQKNYAGAEQALEKAVELDPKDAKAWFNLATVRWTQENYTGAEQAVAKVAELDPKDAKAWFNLGMARSRQGNHAGAEQALESAIALDPDNPPAWRSLVVARFGNYSFKEAWEACTQAIELRPKERSIYGYLVDIYLTTGVANPLPVLERAMKAHSVDPGFHAWLSLLHAMMSLSMGDRTPFLKDLTRVADILESLEEEQKTQIVGELMDFLVGVTYRHTFEGVQAYLAGLSQAVEPVASILAPFAYVLDYFRTVFLEMKKGPMGKQAERVLDLVPSELRNPVEEMVRQVKEQQAWWDRRPKNAGGRKA